MSEHVLTDEIALATVREHWEFFSDHWPVGTRFENGMLVVQDNALNRAYIDPYITDEVTYGKQMLKGSAITRDHTEYSHGSMVLDVREQRTVAWVVHIMTVLRADVLCLQEVSGAVVVAITAAMGGMGTAWNRHMNGGIVKNCEGFVWNPTTIHVHHTNIKPVFRGIRMDASYMMRDEFRIVSHHGDFCKPVEGKKSVSVKMDKMILNDLTACSRLTAPSRGITPACSGRPCALIFAGDLNFCDEDLEEHLPSSSPFIRRTGKAKTHMTAGKTTFVEKFCKFDYILVSDSLDGTGWWAGEATPMSMNMMVSDATMLPSYNKIVAWHIALSMPALVLLPGDDGDSAADAMSVGDDDDDIECLSDVDVPMDGLFSMD